MYLVNFKLSEKKKNKTLSDTHHYLLSRDHGKGEVLESISALAVLAVITASNGNAYQEFGSMDLD